MSSDADVPSCPPGATLLLMLLQQTYGEDCATLLSKISGLVPDRIALSFYGIEIVILNIVLFPWCTSLTDLVCANVDVGSITSCRRDDSTFEFGIQFPNVGSCATADGSLCSSPAPFTNAHQCATCVAGSPGTPPCPSYTMHMSITDDSGNTVVVNVALSGAVTLRVDFDDASSSAKLTVVSGSVRVDGNQEASLCVSTCSGNAVQCNALSALVNDHPRIMVSALNEYVSPLLSSKIQGVSLGGVTLTPQNYTFLKGIASNNVTSPCPASTDSSDGGSTSFTSSASFAIPDDANSGDGPGFVPGFVPGFGPASGSGSGSGSISGDRAQCSGLAADTPTCSSKLACDGLCLQYSGGMTPFAMVCTSPPADPGSTAALQAYCNSTVKATGSGGTGLMCCDKASCDGDTQLLCYDLSARAPPPPEACYDKQTGTGPECDLLCRKLFGQRESIKARSDLLPGHCGKAAKPLVCLNGLTGDVLCVDLAMPRVCDQLDSSLLRDAWTYASNDAAFVSRVVQPVWSDIQKFNTYQLNKTVANVLEVGTVCGLINYVFGYDADSFMRVITDALQAQRIGIVRSTSLDDGATHYVTVQLLPCGHGGTDNCKDPVSGCFIGNTDCSAGLFSKDLPNSCSDPCKGAGICLSNTKVQTPTPVVKVSIPMNVCMCLDGSQGVKLTFGLRCDGKGCVAYVPTAKDSATVAISSISYPGGALPDWMVNIARTYAGEAISDVLANNLYGSGGLLSKYLGDTATSVTGGINLESAATCRAAQQRAAAQQQQQQKQQQQKQQQQRQPAVARPALGVAAVTCLLAKPSAASAFDASGWIVIAIVLVLSAALIAAGAVMLAARRRGTGPTSSIMLAVAVLFVCAGSVAAVLIVAWMAIIIRLHNGLDTDESFARAC